MHFDCKFSYYPQPMESNFFLRPMTVDVMCYVDDYGDTVAARLAIDHLDVSRVVVMGEDLYDVCDCDSAGWEAVFKAIFEPGGEGEWRSDLGIDDPINNVLFMHKAVFHPSLREWQRFIIDHAATLYGHDSAFVMWKGETDLTDKELAELGFRIVAGTDLRVRPNMFQNAYDGEQDERETFDLFVPADAGEYVNVAWYKDSTTPLSEAEIIQAVMKDWTNLLVTVDGNNATVWTPEGTREKMFQAKRSASGIELIDITPDEG